MIIPLLSNFEETNGLVSQPGPPDFRHRPCRRAPGLAGQFQLAPVARTALGRPLAGSRSAGPLGRALGRVEGVSQGSRAVVAGYLGRAYLPDVRPGKRQAAPGLLPGPQGRQTAVGARGM